MNQIEQAVYYLKRMYSRIYKDTPFIIIDKTTQEVTYLLMECWCYSPENFVGKDFEKFTIFCRLIHRACNKFPGAAPYLVDDIIPKIPLKAYTSSELCWMAGYFTAIADFSDDIIDVDLVVEIEKHEEQE